MSSMTTSKQVRIVGKGHASCVEKLLLEWYRRESFVDVILTCFETTEGGMGIRDPSRPIPANRSVLAAASTVFAHMFHENPIVEEDLQITVVGYSWHCVGAVVEYIYTGLLECAKQDEEEINTMLKEFNIPIPEGLRRKHHELPCVGLPSLPSDEVEVYPAHCGSNPADSDSTGVPPVLSSDLNKPPPSNNLKTNRLKDKRSKHPNILRLSASQTPQSEALKVNNITLQPIASVEIVNEQSKTPATALGARVTTPKKSSSQANINGNSSLHSSMTQPKLVPYVGIHPALNAKQYPITNRTYKRVLNRSIDATGTPKDCCSIEPPTMGLTEPFLSKKLVEKSLVQPELLYPSPKTASTLFSKVGASTDPSDVSHLNYYRSTVSALSNVPGVYNLYKERFLLPLERFREMAEIESTYKSVNVKSFLDRKSVRNYQSTKATGPLKTSRLESSSSYLAKVGIESIHESNGKVHIRTKGEPLVNKESESLYEDESASGGPNQFMSRLSMEHNYSFGESSDVSQNQATGDTELASDMEDYKLAIQMTISQQRRRNRLVNRIKSYAKEVAVLKDRARKLISICTSMKNEAHEMDPSSQPVKKPRNVEKFKTKAPTSAPSGPDEDPKVPCPICNKLVKNTWLKQHTLTVHGEERNHLCDECGRTFVLKSQLRNHQKRQHMTVPGNHVCDQCGRVFKFARYLNRHMSFHSNVKPHVCKYCNKAFRLKPVLTKHIRTHTGEKPYHCSTCDKRFRQRTTFANHLKTHLKRVDTGAAEGSSNSSLPRLQCEFCSMTFKLDLFLMLHRAKHTGETPVLPCPSCPDTFPSIKELAQHRKTEHVESVFSCHLCPKLFLNKNNLEYHIEKHSNPNAVKKKYPMNQKDESGPCICDFCEKSFKSRTALDYHIKGIHLGNRVLKCQYCDKTFTHKPSMEQHLRTHTGERPFQCDQCPSAFKLQQHLTAHTVIHTGERPFNCEICDKTFSHKTTLYAHLRIHTGKRLVCTHCKKVLPSVVQLTRHEERCPSKESATSVVDQ